MSFAESFLHPEAGMTRQSPSPSRAFRIAPTLALAALVAGLSCAATAAARDSADLVGLINDYRAAPPPCAGAPMATTGPLTPSSALANAPALTGRELQDALRAAGYAAARALVITLSGPDDAAAAMRLLAERYCRELSSPRYAEIGIARVGKDWRIVLARPLLARDLGSAREAGMRILELVNAARAEPRDCGSRHFAVAPPLQWNAELAAAALAHSADMADGNKLSHAGQDGSRVGARAQAHGYDWRAIGENIAAGQGSAQRAMAGWLASPGHCANIMNGEFAEMGAAYAVDRAGTSTIYWTQVLGSRQEPARK